MIRVVFNQKGGVGKSSIATNLAAISANEGNKTLLIDLDAQCNSSQYLLGDELPEDEGTIAQYFANSLRASFKVDISDYIYDTELANLHIIPASPELGELQSRLESRHKIFKFRDLINILNEKYDRIYIDTPPAYNFYTLSALIAADSVLIPFDCDDFSRKALYTLMDNIEEVKEDHNENLKLAGIVVNQFQPRANQPNRVVNELRAEKLPLLDTYIGTSIKMRESHEAQLPLIYFAPSHKLTKQFVELHQEIEKKSKTK
jgi:chromosome partitioning protein